MDLAPFINPIFIAKLVDFVVFVAGLSWIYVRFGQPALVAHQEAQNRAVDDAVREREQAEADLRQANERLEKSKVDAQHMMEVAQLQAERLISEERVHAEERAQRILAHARGELDRERYRTRRELLFATVERAFNAARDFARRELDADTQARLVERLVTDLEARTHA